MLSGLRVHVAGRVSLFTFREWMGELRWGAVQALRVTNFVGLARSRMLFVLLLQLLCLVFGIDCNSECRPIVRGF